MKIADDKLSLVTYLTCFLIAGIVWSLSRWGFGTSPDSIVYIAGARSLARGAGFSLAASDGPSAPIAQFPPVFSAALALLSVFGIDPLDGAAILNATLLAINLCLSAALVSQATGSVLLGSIAASLTLTAPSLLTTHTMVWSEPLFLSLLLLAAIALRGYRKEPSWVSLLWIALLAALAALTRYAGLSVVVIAAFTISRQNLRHAAVFIVAATLGIAVWVLRSYRFAASTGYKSFGFHPPDAEQLNLAIQTISEWFGGPLMIVIIAGLLVVTLLRRTPQVNASDDVAFLRDFALFYALLLPFMSSFVSAEIPFDRRNLAPIYLTFSLWAIVKIRRMVQSNLRLAWSAAAVLIIALNSWTSIEWLNLLYTRGIGFSSAAWRSSPTITYLAAHRLTRVLTNAPEPLFLLSATPAAMLPRHTDPGTGKKNAGYSEQIAEIKRNSAVVVYFRTVKWRWYLPDEERLKVELAPHHIADIGDGAVYFVGDAQSGALHAR